MTGMARWAAILALSLILGCARETGRGGGGREQGLFSSKDWEASCLKAETPSCAPYVSKLPSLSLGECCRLKCGKGDAPSCVAFRELHVVATPGFWNWPKVRDLPWTERMGVAAPAELIEYLALGSGRRLEPVGEDADLKRDLVAAWNDLPGDVRSAARLIGVSVVKELATPVRAVLVRDPDKKVLAGFLALDWADSLRPANEWATLLTRRALGLPPGAKGRVEVEAPAGNDRRATLGLQLLLGIAAIDGKDEASARAFARRIHERVQKRPFRATDISSSDLDRVWPVH